MKIYINDTEITIPSSKEDITLSQRIAFDREHGNLLGKMMESITAMEDETEKRIEWMEFHSEKMFRVFSFFTNIPVDVLRECDFIEQVAEIYHSTLMPLIEYAEPKEKKNEFSFNNETWVLPGAELKHGDKTSFGEIIDCKQRVCDMAEMEMSLAEMLLPVSAIYLRKKNEEYQEEFLYEGSERLALLEKLPMSIVEQVAFFLNSLIRLSTKISRCFINLRQRVRANIYGITLTVGVG
jgi:hypothetical protein